MAEALIETEALTRVFGGGGLPGWRRPRTVAVDAVSLRVAGGGVLGVVGESGCGKSTLARMLVGLLAPSSGRLRLRGREVTGRERRALRREVQIVFQDPASALNPRRTVGHALHAPLGALRGLDARRRRRRARELMDLVRLDAAFLERYPHELSGGQAQRVAIARALAPEPALVVLDEPTSALDVSVQAQILELLRRLRADIGLTYVFISHDLAVVESFCEEVAVMQRGRVVEQGPRERLFRAPREAYTRRLLAAVPVPGRREPRTQRADGDPRAGAGPRGQPPAAPRARR